MGDVQQVGRAVVVALAFSLAACGSSEKDPGTQISEQKIPTTTLQRKGAVPAGWKVSATPHFSYAHPADWTAEIRPAKTGTTGALVSEARGPAVTEGLPPDVAVTASPRYRSGLQGLLELNTADAQIRYPGRKVLKESSPQVPGAVGARLVEADISNKGPDGTVTPVRQFDLVALSEAATAVNLFVQVPAAEADTSKVRDVIKTLEIR